MDLNSLLRHESTKIIFESVVGSHAYGTATPKSDEDIKGIFVQPANSLLSLSAPPQQVADAKSDIVHYSLARFLELALGANPNIIELLFMPAECVRLRTEFFDLLEENRSLFITKQAYQSHVGYALAQIKKARGQNKWVNNPQPERPPQREDFCWIVPRKSERALPLRPIPLRDANLNLEECLASALEHAPFMYRIYHYGASAKGVFRGGKLVCESIPIEDEDKRCIGLLIANEQAYDHAVRDHRNYWTWRKERNESRWETQESGRIDYDAKNMMHTFRLLMSGESILENGFPIVRFEGEQLEFLMKVRNGFFKYSELIELAESRSAKLEELHNRCSLPDKPDTEKAERLLKEITASWESKHS
ncbi:nucleotidyltransferase domain-containing protein [Pelagicoccus sp. SDUM812005]|uniref:DNA polymerase beta superfamily protein n=1 Tax=Pelagicoccus sp. SDUM812005 TaxID=3041257 RepID=UPI00281057FD|nr:nucleotidyltransferase domain-containing protein [Pelagicoccus sp. SDUM812005]MDQ8183801.1 nucleotidyltransferase domain-containing protein [Pelagicoccus sp. SDUM812005]